ncbi:MAG: class I SAM-dependent methyltransferase [Bacteroidales bacterium]|nr:class I SAM-dependent methyltransferase [Bacteroidales bacterium]
MKPLHPTVTLNQLSAEDQKFLYALVENGGPEPHEYKELTAIINNLEDSELEYFRDAIKESLNENTLIGHGYVKPFGYPGDFTLIHNIYRIYVNPDEKYSNWDKFFQDQAGAHAVRNRKDYFLRRCAEVEKLDGEEKRILILGSGPATDVNEYLNNNPDSKIKFDLVDFDQNAINFAKEQNGEFNESIEYFKINVLRFKPYQWYNLIWSAGLFDYFKDKHFVYMISKYYKYLTDGGEFIIGNFSHSNPTRRLMEVLSDWYLVHRSKYDLVRMALEADAKEEQVEVDMEELGVNLFLRIKAA